MSAAQLHTFAPTAGGPAGRAPETSRRSGILARGASRPECTCPHDCDRDHDNE